MKSSKRQLEVSSTFGVATSRYISCLPLKDDPFVIDVTLGAFIVRWDVREKKQLHSFQAHTDLITCMVRKNTKYGIRTVTVSHGGEVKLWSEQWKLLGSTKVSGVKITHASLSNDGMHLATVASFDGGRLSILKISEGGDLSISTERLGKFEMVEWNKDGNLVGVLVSLTEDSRESVKITLVSPSGNLLSSRLLPGRYATSVQSNGEGMIAIALQGRKVEVLSLSSLDSLWSVEAKGSGAIRSMIFEGEELFTPSDNGSLTQWHKTTLVQTIDIPSGPVFFLGWSIPHSRLWVISESSLFSIPLLSSDPSYNISYHQITCCGVASHGTHVIAGDFSGSVVLWEKSGTAPVAQCGVGSSIRSLCWHPQGHAVLVGTLDGNVYLWTPLPLPGNRGSPLGTTNSLEWLFSLEGSITCLRWDNSSEPSLLLAGSTQGQVAILSLDPGSPHMRIKLVFTAHSFREGSDSPVMEVWSVCWSPDNSFFVTASEDYTAKVWNLQGKEVITLTGHTAAVTSVDWKMTSQGSILGTCADDKSLRIYNGKTFELLHVFHTTEVEEWHTITYMALEVDGSCVMCSTQTGYIFVWSLETKEKIFGEKMHSGSVEGLQWNQKSAMLVSCGSDCTVNVFRLVHSAPKALELIKEEQHAIEIPKKS